VPFRECGASNQNDLAREVPDLERGGTSKTDLVWFNKLNHLGNDIQGGGAIPIKECRNGRYKKGKRGGRDNIGLTNDGRGKEKKL